MVSFPTSCLPGGLRRVNEMEDVGFWHRLPGYNKDGEGMRGDSF